MIVNIIPKAKNIKYEFPTHLACLSVMILNNK